MASHAQRAAPAGLVTVTESAATHVPTGVRDTTPGTVARGRLAHRLLGADTAARRPSYARYVLWGTGVGLVGGYAIGLYSYHHNNSGCNECFVSDEAIVPLAAVLGALSGFVVGNTVYLLARSEVPPTH
jgi:hypothetical protein